jgi:translation initiation factor 2B subunit (eIF-2B alpha/beta/delta family)
LPDHESVVAEAARLVSEIAQLRAQAHHAVVLQAIVEHLDNKLVPAIQTMRALEKFCRDVADSYSASGDTQTAMRIAEAIREAKGRVAVPSANPGAGRFFLNRLWT